MINNYEELYAEIGVKDHATLEKQIFKNTDCGAACHKIENGVRVGSIVEGVDGDGTQYYDLTFPFEIKTFWDKLQEVEDEADVLWKEHNESGLIKDAYVDGECPDCQDPISNDIVEGGECVNCGHVFWLDDSDEAANGYYAD